MEVGDLVRVRPSDHCAVPLVEEDWIGIVIDFRTDDDEDYKRGFCYAIVFWSERFPAEEEYMEQLEVIGESC